MGSSLQRVCRWISHPARSLLSGLTQRQEEGLWPKETGSFHTFVGLTSQLHSWTSLQSEDSVGGILLHSSWLCLPLLCLQDGEHSLLPCRIILPMLAIGQRESTKTTQAFCQGFLARLLGFFALSLCLITSVHRAVRFVLRWSKGRSIIRLLPPPHTGDHAERQLKKALAFAKTPCFLVLLLRGVECVWRTEKRQGGKARVVQNGADPSLVRILGRVQRKGEMFLLKCLPFSSACLRRTGWAGGAKSCCIGEQTWAFLPWPSPALLRASTKVQKEIRTSVSHPFPGSSTAIRAWEGMGWDNRVQSYMPLGDVSGQSCLFGAQIGGNMGGGPTIHSPVLIKYCENNILDKIECMVVSRFFFVLYY